MTHVTVRNGLTLAYMVALVNAALTLLMTFGITITIDQQAAIVAFVNISVMLAARVLHMPERTPNGGTITVQHVPELVETPPAVKPLADAAPEGPAVVPTVG